MWPTPPLPCQKRHKCWYLKREVSWNLKAEEPPAASVLLSSANAAMTPLLLAAVLLGNLTICILGQGKLCKSHIWTISWGLRRYPNRLRSGGDRHKWVKAFRAEWNKEILYFYHYFLRSSLFWYKVNLQSISKSKFTHFFNTFYVV